MLWKDEYATGISAIDCQHQKLVHMATVLEEAVKAHKEMTYATGETLRELVDYVKVHFRD